MVNSRASDPWKPSLQQYSTDYLIVGSVLRFQTILRPPGESRKKLFEKTIYRARLFSGGVPKPIYQGSTWELWYDGLLTNSIIESWIKERTEFVKYIRNGLPSGERYKILPLFKISDFNSYYNKLGPLYTKKYNPSRHFLIDQLREHLLRTYAYYTGKKTSLRGVVFSFKNSFSFDFSETIPFEFDKLSDVAQAYNYKLAFDMEEIDEKAKRSMSSDTDVANYKNFWCATIGHELSHWAVFKTIPFLRTWNVGYIENQWKIYSEAIGMRSEEELCDKSYYDIWSEYNPYVHLRGMWSIEGYRHYTEREDKEVDGYENHPYVENIGFRKAFVEFAKGKQIDLFAHRAKKTSKAKEYIRFIKDFLYCKLYRNKDLIEDIYDVKEDEWPLPTNPTLADYGKMYNWFRCSQLGKTNKFAFTSWIAGHLKSHIFKNTTLKTKTSLQDSPIVAKIFREYNIHYEQTQSYTDKSFKVQIGHMISFSTLVTGFKVDNPAHDFGNRLRLRVYYPDKYWLARFGSDFFIHLIAVYNDGSVITKEHSLANLSSPKSGPIITLKDSTTPEFLAGTDWNVKEVTFPLLKNSSTYVKKIWMVFINANETGHKLNCPDSRITKGSFCCHLKTAICIKGGSATCLAALKYVARFYPTSFRTTSACKVPVTPYYTTGYMRMSEKLNSINLGVSTISEPNCPSGFEHNFARGCRPRCSGEQKWDGSKCVNCPRGQFNPLFFKEQELTLEEKKRAVFQCVSCSALLANSSPVTWAAHSSTNTQVCATKKKRKHHLCYAKCACPKGTKKRRAPLPFTQPDEFACMKLCQRGDVWSGAACTPCSEKETSIPEIDDKCRPCPSGEYFIASLKACAPISVGCKPNEYYDKKTRSCRTCRMNQIRDKHDVSLCHPKCTKSGEEWSWLKKACVDPHRLCGTRQYPSKDLRRCLSCPANQKYFIHLSGCGDPRTVCAKNTGTYTIVGIDAQGNVTRHQKQSMSQSFYYDRTCKNCPGNSYSWNYSGGKDEYCRCRAYHKSINTNEFLVQTFPRKPNSSVTVSGQKEQCPGNCSHHQIYTWRTNPKRCVICKANEVSDKYKEKCICRTGYHRKNGRCIKGQTCTTEQISIGGKCYWQAGILACFEGIGPKGTTGPVCQNKSWLYKGKCSTGDCYCPTTHPHFSKGTTRANGYASYFQGCFKYNSAWIKQPFYVKGYYCPKKTVYLRLSGHDLCH